MCLIVHINVNWSNKSLLIEMCLIVHILLLYNSRPVGQVTAHLVKCACAKQPAAHTPSTHAHTVRTHTQTHRIQGHTPHTPAVDTLQA